MLNVVGSLSAFRARCLLQKAVGRVMACSLPPAERSKLDAVFARFDVNGDGQLGREEVQAMMQALGKSHTDIERFWSSVDSDGGTRVVCCAVLHLLDEAQSSSLSRFVVCCVIRWHDLSK